MRERAERIGAGLKVLSRPASGTEVELCVPRLGRRRPREVEPTIQQQTNKLRQVREKRLQCNFSNSSRI
jgi:hypothetical protein